MADELDQEIPMEIEDDMTRMAGVTPSAPTQYLAVQQAPTAFSGLTDVPFQHHMTVNQLSESTYSRSTMENPQSSIATHVDGQEDTAGSSDMSMAQTDLGTLYVSVQWHKKYTPQKAARKLQKALQSWFNKICVAKTKISCNCAPLNDDTWFSLIMSSSGKNVEVMQGELGKVLESLPKDLELLDEDGKVKHQVQVNFQKMRPEHLETRQSASDIKTPADIPKKDTPADLSDHCNGVVTSGLAANKCSNECSIPLLTYWYMTSAYPKELQRIERDNKVKIQASVKVTIEEDQDTSKNLRIHKALEDFINLVQAFTGDLETHNVRLDQVDSKDLLDVLKYPKTVLSGSSDKLIVYGPSESLRKVQKVLGSHSLMHVPASSGAAGWVAEDQAQNITMDIKDPLVTQELSMPSSLWKFEDQAQNITMDIKDPLVTQELSMPSSLWKLLSGFFGQNIKDIQEKFGVVMKCDSSDGKVLVRPVPSDRQAVSLESNALAALMHLYQRVATSTMSCSLLASNQKAAVQDSLQEIRHLHPHVWPEVTSDSWRLFGLPQHLGPAVTALERKMGGPVFKEEDKKKIPYSGDHRSAPASNAGAASDGGAEGGATAKDDEECSICKDAFTDKQKLKCNHEFCRECLQRSVASLGPTCPLCKHVFGEMQGDQPDGRMNVSKLQDKLPGFHDCGTIVITYDFNGGIQSKRHPNPGKPFQGTCRTAYLPDNKEGQEVLGLLRKAFEQKLIFTIGTSRTTGKDDAITWNDIHHKTNTHGGPGAFGYPDGNYLTRVKEELKSKGIL